MTLIVPKDSEIELSRAELVELGATDSIFFSQAFFPKTVRQAPAPFHSKMWELLDGPDPFINLLSFRGSAKTTLLRLFLSKRIAYMVSKTILIIGKSEGHATQYIHWIRKNITPIKTLHGEKRTLYAETFDLRRGSVWTDEKIHIMHGVEEEGIWVVGHGVTGSNRGLNFDDWRPDLIIVDDIVDEENAATPEQCKKMNELVHGSLVPGLAPSTEAPFRKFVIAQTPQDYDDVSQRAVRSPKFKTARFSCWTPQTEDKPLQLKESSWPDRFKSEDLRADYINAMADNSLSTFSREMEVRLVTPETSIFREEWIQYFGPNEAEEEPPIHEMWTELCIDPVPPPSDKQVAQGLTKKDSEALVVVGKWHGKYYVLEVCANKGHDPSWTVNEFFRMAMRWRIKRVRVEGVGYQRTLAWLLSQAMKTKGIYYPVVTFDDKTKKFHVISTGVKGVLSQQQLFFRRGEEQELLRYQIIHYPNVRHEDELEATARCLIGLQSTILTASEVGGSEEEDEELVFRRGAP